MSELFWKNLDRSQIQTSHLLQKMQIWMPCRMFFLLFWVCIMYIFWSLKFQFFYFLCLKFQNLRSLHLSMCLPIRNCDVYALLLGNGRNSTQMSQLSPWDGWFWTFGDGQKYPMGSRSLGDWRSSIQFLKKFAFWYEGIFLTKYNIDFS